ncbi:MAG: hypothetical protein Tsb0010_09860 [Parvularculaceae bacterium]
MHPYTGRRRGDTPVIFYFGEFDFDPVSGELRRGGAPASLNPQPARLLAYLLEAGHRIVSRDELQEALWGSATTVEFEQGLNTCMSQLRAALGDDARNPRYVKTEPKLGYRFLERVTARPRAAPSEILSEPPQARAARKSQYAALALLVMGLLILLAWLMRPAADGGGAGADESGDAALAERVLRARALRVFGDRDRMAASLEAYAQILLDAPDLAAAQGGAALNLAVLAGSPGFPVGTTYARASALANAAIASNAPSVDGLLARAFVALYDRWDVAEALADFRRAALLAPDYPVAQAWLAAAEAAAGDLDAALIAAERAAALDPAQWYVAADRCWYLNFRRDYARARDVCAGAVAMKPEAQYSQFGLAEARRGLGDLAGAAATLAEIADAVGAPRAGRSYLEQVCALADWAADRPPQSERSYSAYFIAMLEAQCGRHDRAAASLRRAHAGGESFMLFYAHDPRFDGFRTSAAAMDLPIAVRKPHADQ